MVAHVLRLRAAILLGALRGDARHRARTIVGVVVLVAAVALAFAAVLTLGRSGGADAMFVVTVTAGSALTLGFVLGPLIVGTPDPLDPRRFAVLGLEPLRLGGALLVAGLVSVPLLSVVALAVALVVAWTALGVPVVFGVVGALLAVATCAVAARVCMALVALLLRVRQSRELTGVFALLLLVVVVPVCIFLASLEWRGQIPPALRSAAEIWSVTPFGAAWAFPSRIAIGDGGAWWSLAIALVSLAGLVVAWLAIVVRLLTTIERPTGSRDRSTLGWFAVTPGTPGGAIAARSLVYWLRDRRYLVNLFVVPVAAALTLVPLVVAGVPIEVAILVPVPFMALFFGWLAHNDVAYDSTAIWLHLASGVRGLADRAGRLVPPTVIAIPVLAICIPVVVSVHGRWAVLPAVIGLAVCLLFAGLGLSSVSSVVSPYAVSRPGESPFQQPQSTGSAGAMSQAAVFLGALAVSAPVIWWTWLAVAVDPGYAYPALFSGIVIGLAVLVAGVTLGARIFDRSGSRIMEFAEAS